MLMEPVVLMTAELNVLTDGRKDRPTSTPMIMYAKIKVPKYLSYEDHATAVPMELEIYF